MPRETSAGIKAHPEVTTFVTGFATIALVNCGREALAKPRGRRVLRFVECTLKVALDLGGDFRELFLWHSEPLFVQSRRASRDLYLTVHCAA